MSRISVGIWTITNDHWAHAHAASGGDAQFFNATSGHCIDDRAYSQMLNAESKASISSIVLEKDYGGCGVCTSPWSPARPISLAHPHFDFEFKIPQDTPVDFTSYYSTGESVLHFSLDVLYSSSIAKCISPHSRKPTGDEEVSADDAARAEDGLWDTHTPIGEPAIPTSEWERQMTLHATVPITVVDRAVPAHSFVHYLTPDVPTPVLRSGMQLDMPPSFPATAPVIIVEDLASTSSRLLQHASTNSRGNIINLTRIFENYPAKDYRGGPFADVLWRKKMIAEESGIFPQGAGVEGEGRDGQKPFSLAP
jgi:hypothetical protein